MIWEDKYRYVWSEDFKVAIRRAEHILNPQKATETLAEHLPLEVEFYQAPDSYYHRIVSPKGRYFVYCTGNEQDGFDLYAYQLDSGEVQELKKDVDYLVMAGPITSDKNFVFRYSIGDVTRGWKLSI